MNWAASPCTPHQPRHGRYRFSFTFISPKGKEGEGGEREREERERERERELAAAGVPINSTAFAGREPLAPPYIVACGGRG